MAVRRGSELHSPQKMMKLACFSIVLRHVTTELQMCSVSDNQSAVPTWINMQIIYFFVIYHLTTTLLTVSVKTFVQTGINYTHASICKHSIWLCLNKCEYAWNCASLLQECSYVKTENMYGRRCLVTMSTLTMLSADQPAVALETSKSLKQWKDIKTIYFLSADVIWELHRRSHTMTYC